MRVDIVRLFIDSAERELVAPLLETGLFCGVTTNPTLLARAGLTVKQLPDFATWAREAGAKTVFVQAWGETFQDYSSCAMELLARCGDIVVKVPATPAGISAVRALESNGIRTLLTGVYNHTQVIPAILAGATYLAPYLGRMNDAGRDGIGEITRMQEIIEASQSNARILVASIRSPHELAQLALVGIRDFTIAPALWHELLVEPLTDAAVRVFDADTRKLMS